MLSRTAVTRRRILEVRKLPSLCFSAECRDYVKRAKYLENLKSSPNTPENVFTHGKYMVLLKSDLVCISETSQLIWKNYQDVQSIALNGVTPTRVLLGLDLCKNETCLFSLDFTLTCENDMKKLELTMGGKFVSAREALLRMNNIDCQYVAKAKGLSSFCKTFMFCHSCSGQLVVNDLGTQKQCQGCKKTHYPPVSPVGIVLIDDEKHKKVLLVRQERHPPGMYSCVAGFMEPGETLFECVRREVAEEVGIDLLKIDFASSQVWAMPNAQLMLACLGTAQCEKVDIDEKEIINATWVSADILRDAVVRAQSMNTSMISTSDKSFCVPPPFTASHQLMVEWLNRYHSFRCAL